jgi:hypothetical protein
MSKTFYIRFRGKVQGPFDKEKLRALAKRGQFSRAHEISENQIDWTSAQSVRDIFSSASSRSRKGSTNETPTDTRRKAPEWYYVEDSEEVGPVSTGQLTEMIAEGRLSTDTLVWANGMKSWAPASSLTTFSRLSRSTQLSEPSIDETLRERLDDTLTQAAMAGRGWVLFIAVIGFLLCVFDVVVGIWQTSLGFHVGNGARISGGLTLTVQGLLILAGACILTSYFSRLGRLRTSPVASTLQAAMRSLSTLWAFTGIVLVVVLAFVLVIGIWAVSIGGTLSAL